LKDHGLGDHHAFGFFPSGSRGIVTRKRRCDKRRSGHDGEDGSAMLVTRRRVIAAGGLLFGAGLAATRARAAAFPSRQIRIFVPFSAGTTLDVMGRTLSEAIEPLLGQAPVVVNRSGAAGLIALTEILAAQADGHTWLLSGAGQFTIQPHLRVQQAFQPTDFVPVCQLYDTPLMLVVNLESSIASFEELLALARAKPRTLTVANYGPGSATHLMMSAVAKTSGVEFLGVSYRSQGQLVQDLLTGTVQAAVLAPGSYAPDLVRQLLVLAPVRLASAPEVPTIEEAGQPLPFVSFAGIHVARAVPEAIVSAIETACIKAAASEIFETAARRAQVRIDVQPHDVFAQRIAEQSRDMRALISSLGMKIE
jgi:tripartite-type tricarboxylate transporter receptor subunit TctC